MDKVHFAGPGPHDSETLWASALGHDLYCLENSPFFAYGVSWLDLVEARPTEIGTLEYVRVVKKSGNRTLRVIFQQYRSDEAAAQVILTGLRELACSYEGMQPRLISINVPTAVDLHSVTDFLKA